MGGYRLRALIGSDVTVRHFAWLTLLASLGLSLVGVYIIDVGTRDVGGAAGGGGGGAGGAGFFSGFVLKQLIFLAIGMGAAAAVALPHYRFVRLVAWPAMWVTLALLIFLIAPGVPAWLVTPRNGA